MRTRGLCHKFFSTASAHSENSANAKSYLMTTYFPPTVWSPFSRELGLASSPTQFLAGNVSVACPLPSHPLDQTPCGR